MTSPPPETPFQINISDGRIAELRQRLALTKFPSSLEDAGWAYGAPLPDIQRLVNRWKDGYDWRKYESALNSELPQYTKNIEVEGFGTLNIHYVHKRSEVEGALPLLFVHGWPGSFVEVRKILPLLVASSTDHPSFHVVALSLPGFGFSEAPTKKGFKLDQYSEVSNELMLALGYNEYVTQGGDWGALITHRMSQLHGPASIKAWHTNFPLAQLPSLSRPFTLLRHFMTYVPLFGYTSTETTGLERTKWYSSKSSAYLLLQSTQPQTLGYSLADSPVGLLAWIYEKLVQWTDGYKWDDDEVLDWISLYYFSRAGPAASVNIYYEVIQGSLGESLLATAMDSSIPAGYSHFPKELVVLPRRWYTSSNIVFRREHESGGHFAAYEKPEALVEDLRKMFGKGGGAFGVVKGKNGYAA
ncbi:Alpha/Beta hydrolase protein [Collybia nuda]|uniref:Alpha/Beta hydrolase protein n=1 Tax=Collybia nuda TaxID=64659 RepID=A0A9P5YHC6_9AGAR|nr:Alpha/Beta hydrolase protein [Collybia nuda]